MNKRVVRLALALFLAAAFSGVGCGTADDPPEGAGRAGEVALDQSARCFSEAGAVLVDDSEQISAFVRDYSSGNVDKPAGAGNGIAKVTQYEPSGVADPSGRPRPASYLVFVGQMVDQAEVDPATVPTDDDPGTFIAYLSTPTSQESAAAENCLKDFGARRR